MQFFKKLYIFSWKKASRQIGRNIFNDSIYVNDSKSTFYVHGRLEKLMEDYTPNCLLMIDLYKEKSKCV